MPTNDNNEINNNVIEVMDEQELYEKYGYEAPEDEEPVDPNDLLVEDEYPECDVVFADGVVEGSPLPTAFKDAVMAPEASEVKEAEQTTEDSETSEAEAAEKAAQAAAIAELLARTEGAPRLSETAESFFSAPPVEFTVEGLIQVGGLTFINGESFDGKSLMTMDMAGAIIRGEPWCGREVKMASVFYFDYDDARTINSERFQAICRHQGVNDESLKRWHFISADNLGALNASNPRFAEFFAREVLTSPDVQKTGRAVIIIDTLRAFCVGVEMTERTPMSLMLEGLRQTIRILAKCGVQTSIVVLHHYRKDTTQETQYQAKTIGKKITATLRYNDNKIFGSNEFKIASEVICHIISDPQNSHHKVLVTTKNKGADPWVRKILDMRFKGQYESDTLVDFGISAVERPLYDIQDDDDSDTDTAPQYNQYQSKQTQRRSSVDSAENAEKVLQYISEHPGVGRFEVRNAGVVNTNSSKGIIDRLISEGRLVEGASAGSARKGQGLYVA